jgi:hypothetical protein
MKESPIFTRTYDLVRWLIPVTIKFPRQQRFVLAARIQHSVLNFHEQIIDAGLSQQPEPILRRADVTLARLRVQWRLCRDLELVSMGQYAHGARMLSEVGRLLGGWLKKDKEPTP